MPSASSVLLLADAPEVIPTLAAWYKNEWPACFAETPLEAIEADFHSAANRDCLPLASVAFDVTGVPMGGFKLVSKGIRLQVARRLG